MSDSLSLLLSAVLAWLVGSIPFSLLIAKWIAGIDLREHGSRNVGATNVARTVGAKWGLAALVFDAIKGILPVVLLPLVFPVPTEWMTHQRVLCGVAAILGHMFPPWLGFRGGKGVATSLGIVAVLSPWSTLVAFISFVVTFAGSRIVSLSSIVAALAFAVSQLLRFGNDLWTAATWSMGVFSIAIPAMIIFRHRTNLGRLWRGEEPKLALGRKASASTSSEPDRVESESCDRNTRDFEKAP
ncbi:MAG: glycerol-3-phosphate 1-O-acyltransferase PlsY [Planctomycetaceae bacterium]|nr:glycerol-3-phosphate 1-O-acyltransferase PlsY [Planctomycetaceae bacterium]